MKPRAAALAFAAPLLLTAPALADHGKSAKRVSGTIAVQTDHGGVYLNLGHAAPVRIHHRNGYRDYRRHGYSVNEYGQTRDEVRYLKRRATQVCRAAIKSEAYRIGFRDVDFDDGRRAYQIGPRAFEITFREVEFEGRRRDFERPVTCVVRKGDRVKRIEGIPTPGHRGHYSHRDYDGKRYRY